MIDLDAEIRQTVYEWAESAPMPPSLTQLEGAVPTGHPHRPKRVLLGVAAVVMALLVVAVAVSVRDRAETSTVQSTPAPDPATFDDVAGQSLAARFGVPSPSDGYQLADEFGRDAALTAADGTLPAGPLGPLYAQSIELDGVDSAWSYAVVSVLPVEQDDVVVGASGHHDGASVTVAGHSATFVTAWSGDDANVVTWQERGVAVVVVGRSGLDQSRLVALAGEVAPIDDVPILPVGDEIFDPTTQQLTPAFWSLAPAAPQPLMTPGPNAAIRWTGWSRMRGDRAVVLGLSTVVDHGRTERGAYTVRATGHPDSSGSFGPGATSHNADGSAAWDTAEYLRVETRGIEGEGQDIVDGMGPTSVVQVRVHLSDGQTFVGPTYDAGRGWPVRLFGVPLPGMHTDPTPGGLHIVRLDGLGADGELRNAGLVSLGNGADGGVESGMVGSCHPAEPTAFVFTDLCQGG